RGIIPDPLNKLHEALLFPQLAMILDKIAVGIKDMVGQVGMPPTAASEEAIKKGEDASELKEKPTIEKKPGKEEVSPKEEKPAIEKKPNKKKKPAVEWNKHKRKRRPVKIPPRVTKKAFGR